MNGSELRFRSFLELVECRCLLDLRKRFLINVGVVGGAKVVIGMRHIEVVNRILRNGVRSTPSAE